MDRTRRIDRAREFSPSALLAFVGFLLFCVSGCKHIPEGRDAIDKVDLLGAPWKVESELEDGMATKATPKVLGIVKRLYEYTTLDEVALEKDIQRVERQLRRRGYYQGRVIATRVIRTAENRVRVEVEIDPGEPVRIRKLETTGLAQLPFAAAEAATNEMRLRVGDIFDEDDFETAKQDVVKALADRGYAYAKVEGKAEVDLANQSVHVTLHATPGVSAKLGKITITGLHKLEEGPVRRTLKLSEGQDYSLEELSLARSALFQLGVFSQVELILDLDDPTKEVIPVTVQLQESTLRDVTLGGGVRLDQIRFAAVGQAGWTHRNFLGGLRKFSVTTRPGINFYPTSFTNFQAPTKVFPENALTFRLEQPGFLEGRTRGFTEAGYNVYPLLWALKSDLDPEEERVIGYNEVTTALGLERVFFGRLLSTSLSVNWQANFPFAYQRPESEIAADPDSKGLGIEGLDTVIVAYPELRTIIDLRDDPIETTRGAYLSNSLQVGVPVLGGLVNDVRIQPELRTYYPLDNRHRLILATRATVGMTFPFNYGDALTDAGSNLDYTDPAVVTDQHKLLFRAFYSGGPNSNRGYPFQRIGPQGVISFLLPPGETCEGSLATLDETCLRPLGGFTLWEASLELRYRAFKDLSLVGFIDASDVSSKVARFTFYEPHIAIGPGLRYFSPVGPIRVDLGWRVPGLQALRENPDEPPDVSRTPPYSEQNDDRYTTGEVFRSLSLHILIGESF